MASADSLGHLKLRVLEALGTNPQNAAAYVRGTLLMDDSASLAGTHCVIPVMSGSCSSIASEVSFWGRCAPMPRFRKRMCARLVAGDGKRLGFRV